MNLTLPSDYTPLLDIRETEKAIKVVKDFFELNLQAELRLRRITAPLFVLKDTGINDNLSGVERPVAFPIKDMGGAQAEVVQSLAKWKRLALAKLAIEPGYGIYTDMNAIRADEELSNMHSLYVDQWDWEMVITKKDRSVAFLKNVVRRIYEVLKRTEFIVYETYPHLVPVLPETIHFIHSEELLRRFPKLGPREREDKIAQELGAVFIIGIGGALSDGKPHDLRAPDYDDWTSQNEEGFSGLNGDIILWNEVLGRSFEISSMGIRVDPDALLRQLELSGTTARKDLYFHRMLLKGDLPLSIGGGLGQSRICMFLLKKAHVGEVQASVWPDEMLKLCAERNIPLL